MTKKNLENDLQFINNTDVYLSQNILEISELFMKKTTKYNQMMKLFIYMLICAYNANSQSDCKLSLNSRKLAFILGIDHRRVTYNTTKDILAEFKRFINSDVIKKTLKVKENFLLAGKYNNEDKIVDVWIKKDNYYINSLIGNNEKFVTFKYGAINTNTSSKYYLFLFLLFASRNKLNNAHYSLDKWKDLLNLSKTTNSSRVKSIFNDVIDPLSKYFFDIRFSLQRKTSTRKTAINVTWTKYDSQTGSNERATHIVKECQSYININDIDNEFFNNWQPNYTKSLPEYSYDLYKYFNKFTRKHKTHISNENELFMSMIKSYQRENTELTNLLNNSK